MKIIILTTTAKRIFLASLTALVAMTAAAQVRPFVQAGVGTSQFWLMNADGTEKRFAYYGGAGIECPIKDTPLGIQAALVVTSKGADAPPAKNDNVETNINLIYLEMPLDVTYRTAIGGLWGLRLAGGPYFSYGIGGKTKVDTSRLRTRYDSFGGDSPMRRFDAGLNAQVLFEYKKLFFGMNWDLGFIPIHEKERELDNKTFPSNTSAAITVGVYLK